MWQSFLSHWCSKDLGLDRHFFQSQGLKQLKPLSPTQANKAKVTSRELAGGVSTHARSRFSSSAQCPRELWLWRCWGESPTILLITGKLYWKLSRTRKRTNVPRPSGLWSLLFFPLYKARKSRSTRFLNRRRPIWNWQEEMGIKLCVEFEINCSL